MKLLGFLNLRRISGQIAALVIVSIAALHLIITTVFLISRPDQPEPFMDGGNAQLLAAVQFLGAAPVSERPHLAAEIARVFPQLDIQDLPVAAATEPQDHPDLRMLRRRLGADYRVFALAPNGDVRRIGSVTLLGLWAARALTAPLSSFAKAAENFSLNSATAPLPERGPEEIRFLARALNRMRERIGGLIDDRTRMLAAISHDLRTPITRMRLRAEFIEDDAHRGRTLADLDQMRSMLESVLSFLRNDRKLESMTLVDIASTLQLVTDQFADMGHNVNYAGPDHAMATARPDDLHRSVTNLVENAVRFGAEATIRLTMSAESATIDVEDDGPGISDAHKTNMLEPFVRGDDARNMDEASGFGLGLSITHAIVLAHGGELTLHDRQPHGLIARIQIPLRQQRQRAAA